MRAWLFHIHVFAGLHCPDSDSRMPVMRSGDGNSIDRLVVNQLPNIGIGFRLKAHLANLGQALTHYAVIDITKGRNFNVRQRSITGDVVFAPSTQAYDRNSHPIVRTENSSLHTQRMQTAGNRNQGRSHGSALQKISSTVIHFCTPPSLFWISPLPGCRYGWAAYWIYFFA